MALFGLIISRRGRGRWGCRPLTSATATCGGGRCRLGTLALTTTASLLATTLELGSTALGRNDLGLYLCLDLAVKILCFLLLL